MNGDDRGSSSIDTSLTSNVEKLTVIRPYGYSNQKCGCCPTLTTRLLTKDFRPTKSQRKVLKKMENTLKSSPVSPQPGQQQLAMTPMSIKDAATATATPKKQKRHHIENNIKLITSKIGGNCSDPDLCMKKKPSSHSSLEERVLSSELLKKLEKVTNNALQKSLSSLLIIPNLDKKGEVKEQEQQKPSKYEWKTEYRLLSPSKKERNKLTIRAVSNVCGQISGQLSSSGINQISRGKLVEQIVEAIKEEILPLQNSTISSVQKDKKRFDTAVNDKTSMVSIAAIEAHPPTGQIRCTIQVQQQQQQQQQQIITIGGRSDDDAKDSRYTSDKDVEIINESSNESAKNHTKTNSKLEKWYENTTGKQLQLEPSQHNITIETMPAHQSAINPDVHRLYALYQHVIHNDLDPFTDDQIDNSSNNIEEDDDDEEKHLMMDIDDPSTLDWGNAPSYFTETITSVLTKYIQSIPEDYRRSVLANYYSFYQFLVENPFPLPVYNSRSSKNENNHTSSSSSQQRCGLYHQHYRLGGDLLIAVGVIDILPTGLSSVYLFYHPSFSYDLVALGKYAILKEIEFARDTLKVPYYYLGYYIESCQKMRYKAEYKPTQMLCPKYYEWVDATEAITKLRMTQRHVCPLIEANQNGKEDEGGYSNSADTNSKTIDRMQQSTVVEKDNDMDIDIAATLLLDIGAGINVTIDMLQSSGVEVVRPILDEFILEFSPALSKKCLIKLS
ncbi:ATE_C-domain-containing protein [Fragilariopsis cylindrus CCMP1102]|uniref:ATE_C-domain-containing protein n=1 Tax=Fragilariopsis cylindrus CCMP1102 TaxID=635003 RepID=A0A1E7ESH4_9STRA|nr:ATE_C-domain-containing protein [Fragilariopsis cylindrus CCMP1102]|eukprot:OEU08911.1 ATE_C-domain-containing protein [Fragilariopsis cylindrus CCMP1102]